MKTIRILKGLLASVGFVALLLVLFLLLWFAWCQARYGFPVRSLVAAGLVLVLLVHQVRAGVQGYAEAAGGTVPAPRPLPKWAATGYTALLWLIRLTVVCWILGAYYLVITHSPPVAPVTLKGKVVNAQGAAVEGINIALVPSFTGSDSGELYNRYPKREAVSDATGSYTLAEVQPLRLDLASNYLEYPEGTVRREQFFFGQVYAERSANVLFNSSHKLEVPLISENTLQQVRRSLFLKKVLFGWGSRSTNTVSLLPSTGEVIFLPDIVVEDDGRKRPDAAAAPQAKEEPATQAYSPPTTSAEGLYQEGSRLQKAGKTGAAIAAWRALIDRFPDSGRAGCAAVYIGQQQLADKAYADAEKSFSLAAEKFGHHKYGNGVEVGGYAYFYLASVYCETEQYDKAVGALKALAEKFPYASGHRSGDALLSMRAKKWFYDKLVAKGFDLTFLDELIARQKDPKNFGKLNAPQLYLVAYTLKKDGEDEKAAEAFKMMVWKYPNERFTPYACLCAFELQAKLKQYDAALASARAMSERFPDVKVEKGGPLGAIGHFSVGAVHFEKQEYKESAEAFQRVARDFPAAANAEGVSLRSLVAERYEKALGEKGFKVEGLRD
jgi:TolA-binding protein